jgi:hypothetical protein
VPSIPLLPRVDMCIKADQHTVIQSGIPTHHYVDTTPRNSRVPSTSLVNQHSHNVIPDEHLILPMQSSSSVFSSLLDGSIEYHH